MPEKQVEESDDMHRIIEVLQSQIASMQNELNDVKTELKHAKEETPPAQLEEVKIKAEPEPEPETEEEVLEYLKKLPGIGLSKANALYKHGFDTTAKLKEATAEDFKEVQGIGPSMASKLVESIEKLEAGTLEAEAPAVAPEPEKPAEGGGPMGFFKNFSSKLMGFIRGKKPEGETAVEEESKRGGEEESGAAKEEEGVSVGEEESPEEMKDEAEEEEKPSEEVQDERREASASDEEFAEDTPSVEIGEPPAELAPPEPEEPKELTREDILKQYKNLEGVTDTIAAALYDAGYESMAELKEAEEDDLKMVKGIEPKTAGSIVKALKERD